ncbi:MAG: hypothetical protein AB1547_10030 [Thermodesulfobacteriota bacterium]
MGLSIKYLPRATPLDPAEDPPGSVDPLGTLGPAERIAEVLFPGLTARMWRPRLLTFAAVTALVAERAKSKLSGPEDGSLAARLSFERLFVSAIVRQQVRDPEKWRKAARRLPGTLLARRALLSGDTPLGRTNFLKGQAVNGPYGVVARLARHLGIIDEDDILGRVGEELLLAWSADKDLPGLLDENNSGLAGKQWLNHFTQATVAHLVEQQWRSPGWSGWQELADSLRPDEIGRQERTVLLRLLDDDPIRCRCIELLCQPNAIAVYRGARDGGRGEQDRKVLLEALLPALSVNERETDRVIDLTIRLADAYEEIACHFETAFQCLLWGLTRRGGQAKPLEIEADEQLVPVFRSLCQKLPEAAQRLRDLIEIIPTAPQIAEQNPLEPLDIMASQATTAAESPTRLIETVMTRHRDVQASKRKGMWIEPGERWTLLPGFGLASDVPPLLQVTYLHTFRVPNAYSFLAELGLSGLEVPDGEA